MYLFNTNDRYKLRQLTPPCSTLENTSLCPDSLWEAAVDVYGVWYFIPYWKILALWLKNKGIFNKSYSAAIFEEKIRIFVATWNTAKSNTKPPVKNITFEGKFSFWSHYFHFVIDNGDLFITPQIVKRHITLYLSTYIFQKYFHSQFIWITSQFILHNNLFSPYY